ncbi:MAG TPA: hypothetical protein VLB86_11440 [Gaiellaceae bacterium]|nr:hypothetical protein [Gaiellaceae bacterium]
MSRKAWWYLVAVAGVALALPASGFAERPTAGAIATARDTVHADAVVERGTLPVAVNTAPIGASARALSSSRALLNHGNPQVGESFVWLGLDDFAGQYLLKFFTLRAIGTHAEVWVANNLNFPTGDCRNVPLPSGSRVTITDAQAQYLLNEFDTNMYPKESAAFSVPPERDGSNETIRSLVPPAIAALMHPEGAGDRTVVLVDNVRDDNYYDTNNANGFSYIAGFYSSQLDAFFDRTIMTIDAFDWIHRTTANPPNEPVPGSNCTSAPARPFLYEGVFAHEYQHLLEQYEDSDEVNWVNEGLSDWAQTLVGYVNPSIPITNVGFDSHVQCFLGWLGVQTPANPNPRPTSGPENSLTRWGDQGQGEILCDYGAAYTMMEYLHGLYGTSFMTALHRGDLNGLDGLAEALAGASSKLTPEQVLHNWSLMVALDGLIDDGARILGPYAEKLFTAPTLDATINWDTEHAYGTPGAPSNGSDYVRLRDAAGNYLNGGQIDSLSFEGATTHPPLPIRWTVAADPPLQAGDPALYSGFGNNRDEAIVREVAVPGGAGATLTFNALWNQEVGWDFGFVQVSTDGGASYQSVACTDTTTTTNPDALPTAKENVPGFTGFSGTWKAETCSLSAYAGQTVLLAFRTFNDPATLGESATVPPGFWVDDVAVGGTVVSDGSTLTGWRSPSEVRPDTVAGFTVRIVSIDGDKITVRELPLTSGFSVHGQADVQKYVDSKAGFVAAVVFYDDPDETSTNYARYRLTVNGVVQPGGGT